MPSDISKRVTAIQGNPVSKIDPTTGQVLEWNGTEWIPTNLPSSLPPDGPAGGDLSGTYPDPTVAKIQGNTVSNASPSDGQVLTWVAADSKWEPKDITDVDTLAGDVTGPLGSNTVVKIDGASVPSAGSLTTGNVLQVNGASSLTYAPINLAGGTNFVTGVLPTSNQASQAISGDVTGTTSASTVVKLQGNSVSNTAPSNGQVLEWNATNSDWEPTNLPSSLPPSGSAGGDLSGTYPDPTVVALQGNPVSSTTPTTNYVLEWNGTAWTPTALPSSLPPSGTAGGDLSGTYPNPSVAKINGTSVSTSPSANQVLVATGSTTSAWQQIVDAQISATASIAGTKISPSFGSQNISTSGTLSAGGTTVTSIKDTGLGVGVVHSDASGNFTSSAIVNADVSASAAIDYSKLNLTGDIVNADINASAAIAYSKLNLTGSIVNADINASAAITGTKVTPSFGSQNVSTTGTLSVGGATVTSLQDTGLGTGVVHSDSSGNFTSSTLVNADVSSSAAIAVSKLAAGTSAQVLLNNSTPTPTWTSISGDISLTNAGATTVTALQGRAVASTAPTSNQVLTWNSGASQWQPAAAPGFTAGYGNLYNMASFTYSGGNQTLTFNNAGPSSNTTLSTSAGSITVTNAGYYLITWSYSFNNGNTPQSTWIYINGTQKNGPGSVTSGYNNAASSTILSLNASDVLTLRMHFNNNDTFTVNYGDFNVIRIA